MAKAKTRAYKAKNGRTRFMPSIEYAMLLNEESLAFCIGCKSEHGPLEPDARKAHCPDCGEHTVYGAEQLVLMGLTF